LDNRYNTIAHYDDPLPGESPKKELTYFEKKRKEKNMNKNIFKKRIRYYKRSMKRRKKEKC